MTYLNIFWLAAMALLAAVEASTMGLTCIWFALGALGAFVMSFITANLTVQLMVFALLSALALIFVKPIASKRVYTKRTATNADRVIGASGVVTQQIDNTIPTGQVTVAGQVWTARAANEDEIIPQGVHVRIKEISGVKLIVEKINETKECSTL